MRLRLTCRFTAHLSGTTDVAHKNTSTSSVLGGTHLNKSAVSASTPSLMLQVTAMSAECSARSGWADQVQAKQQLVTEAGQRGCWDTQGLYRQPACHPLFFISPYTHTSLHFGSWVSLKEHGKNRHITIRVFTAHEWMIAGRISSPSFHLTSRIVLLYTYRWYATFFCCAVPREQGSTKKVIWC